MDFIDTVTKRVQADDGTMAEVRAIFDEILNWYLSAWKYLDVTSDIVGIPLFCSTVEYLQAVQQKIIKYSKLRLWKKQK